MYKYFYNKEMENHHSAIWDVNATINIVQDKRLKTGMLKSVQRYDEKDDKVFYNEFEKFDNYIATDDDTVMSSLLSKLY